VEAAKRETLEEAAISIELEGVVRAEHLPRQDGTARIRVVLRAHPADDKQLKQKPDQEFIEARWFSIQEMEQRPLRGAEGLEILTYLSKQPTIAPLSILMEENTPSETLHRHGQPERLLYLPCGQPQDSRGRRARREREVLTTHLEGVYTDRRARKSTCTARRLRLSATRGRLSLNVTSARVLT